MKRSSNHSAKNELNISVKNKTSLKTIFKLKYQKCYEKQSYKNTNGENYDFFFILKYNVMFHTDKNNSTILSYLVTTKSTDI